MATTGQAGSGAQVVDIDQALQGHEATLAALRDTLSQEAQVTNWAVVREPTEGECLPDSRSQRGPVGWIYRTTQMWSAPIDPEDRAAMESAMDAVVRIAADAGFGDPVMVSSDEEITAWDFAELAPAGEQSHLFVSVGDVAVLQITSSCHPPAP